MENELVISEDKENEYDPFNPTDSDIEIENKVEKVNYCLLECILKAGILEKFYNNI